MLPLLGWAIWCAPAAENGLVTLWTQGSGSTPATTLLIAASLAELVIGRARVEDDVGGVARLRRERLACRMFVACCDGVFPAVNLFSKCVPTTWATTVTPMMARIHSDQHRPATVVTGAGQTTQHGVGVLGGPGAPGVLRAPISPIRRVHGSSPVRFITDELYHRIPRW